MGAEVIINIGSPASPLSSSSFPTSSHQDSDMSFNVQHICSEVDRIGNVHLRFEVQLDNVYIGALASERLEPNSFRFFYKIVVQPHHQFQAQDDSLLPDIFQKKLTDFHSHFCHYKPHVIPETQIDEKTGLIKAPHQPDPDSNPDDFDPGVKLIEYMAFSAGSGLAKYFSGDDSFSSGYKITSIDTCVRKMNVPIANFDGTSIAHYQYNEPTISGKKSLDTQNTVITGLEEVPIVFNNLPYYVSAFLRYPSETFQHDSLEGTANYVEMYDAIEENLNVLSNTEMTLPKFAAIIHDAILGKYKNLSGEKDQRAVQIVIKRASSSQILRYSASPESFEAYNNTIDPYSSLKRPAMFSKPTTINTTSLVELIEQVTQIIQYSSQLSQFSNNNFAFWERVLTPQKNSPQIGGLALEPFNPNRKDKSTAEFCNDINQLIIQILREAGIYSHQVLLERNTDLRSHPVHNFPRPDHVDNKHFAISIPIADSSIAKDTVYLLLDYLRSPQLILCFPTQDAYQSFTNSCCKEMTNRVIIAKSIEPGLLYQNAATFSFETDRFPEEGAGTRPFWVFNPTLEPKSEYLHQDILLLLRVVPLFKLNVYKKENFVFSVRFDPDTDVFTLYYKDDPLKSSEKIEIPFQKKEAFLATVKKCADARKIVIDQKEIDKIYEIAGQVIARKHELKSLYQLGSAYRVLSTYAY
jgi:hypothetical protein